MTQNTDSDDMEAIYRVFLFIVSIRYRVLLVRTVFFRVVCEELRLIPWFIGSDGVLSGCV